MLLPAYKKTVATETNRNTFVQSGALMEFGNDLLLLALFS